MNRYLQPFLILSALGLFLSVTVHVCALLGVPSPLGERAWLLHLGIFAVWIPTVVIMRPLAREYGQADLWRTAFQGCPSWMRGMTYGFLAYAAVNFAILIVEHPRGRTPSGATPDAVFRGFSGHWMAFYSIAFSALYSAARSADHESSRRCEFGHPVPLTAEYCEQCGRPVPRAEAARPEPPGM